MQKQINVIGHLTSSSGLGNAARMFIQVLRKNGYRVVGLDVDYHADKTPQQAVDIEMFDSVESLPFDVNLIVVSIQIVPSLWRRRYPGLLAPRFKNVGLLFWELPVIPPAWVPGLALFDAVLTCSHYVRQALEVALPDTRTFFAEHPLDPDATIGQDAAGAEFRKTLGLNATDTVFMSSFDLRSDYTRKNPLAVLEAFKDALADCKDARLVIKANGASTANRTHPVVARIHEHLAADPRILLFTETLPYHRVMALYAASDVYLSLHRAEGLGLGPMEAMLLGKLVIATGYSGNLTFMTQQNSMLVDYLLVEPVKTGWQYERRFSGPGAAWAEPDKNEAADAVRTAYSDVARRRSLAAAGRADILRRQETAWAAPWLAGLERFLDQYEVPLTRPVLKRRMMFYEVADPTLRRLNVRAIYQRLRQR